jgi:type VI protein secretion system component VasF
MDHHEQHHQHHEKEREQRIKHEKESERQADKRPWKVHPAWLLAVGAVLILVAVLIWTMTMSGW